LPVKSHGTPPIYLPAQPLFYGKSRQNIPYA
jgi:hypothetical protein